MTFKLNLSIILTSLALLAWSTHAHAQEPTLRRFALVVGANNGGAERPALRYAGADAASMQRVLTDLGGVNPEDSLLLLQPDRASLEQALGLLAARLEEARAADVRTEVIFFYSGHSDERGLLLGPERMDYRALRLYIQSMPADVRVAVLDSCASGSLTRAKGGDKVKPFLIDDASQVRGYAFLTSAAEDEAAQESDRVRGSFFTHYLLTGLRGGADTTGDGRVTLSEAYEFAFRETLARTETTAAGPQHAAYDINLSGSGDLVLTDLRTHEARMVLAEDLHGRLYLRRDSDQTLVAELFKPRGRTIALGLEPGRYLITLDDQGRLTRGAKDVTASAPAVLHASDLRAVEPEATASRGGNPADDTTFIPWDLGLLPGLQLNDHHDEPTTHALQLNLLLSYADRIQGAQGAIVGNIATGDVNGVQIAAVFNAAHGVQGGQYSSAVNINDGDLTGAQITGAANINTGDLAGLQIAGGANINTGAVELGQITGGANINTGDLHGFQIAGGANINGGQARGLQIAGGLNLAAEGTQGTQIAPVNISGGQSTGAQIGVINIGNRVNGAMVGVINIASELEGAPIGLLNFIGNGQLHLDLWTDDVTRANAAVRFGSRHVYTLLGAGATPEEDGARWLLIAGVGGHITLDPLFIDIDALYSQVHIPQHTAWPNNSLARLRLALGWQLMDHLAVFGGAALNVFIADEIERAHLDLGPEADPNAVGTTVSLWPGFFAGVQF